MKLDLCVPVWYNIGIINFNGKVQMNSIQLQKVKAFEPFDDGSVKAVYHGGGSYDRYLVYSDGELVVDMAVNHRGLSGQVWTWSFKDKESPIAFQIRKALAGQVAA